jgi:catalase
MTKDEQQRLFENTGRNMSGVPDFIKHRHIKNCYLATTNMVLVLLQQ